MTPRCFLRPAVQLHHRRRSGAALRQHLVDLRDGDAAILLLSADLEEVPELSDQIAVLFNEEVVAHFPAGAHMSSAFT